MENYREQEEKTTPASRLGRHRSARRQINQPVLTLFASVLVLSLLFGLGGLRLYCLSMERKLSSLEEKILQAEELRLQQERELASLLSPSRVYSYAHANLDMQRSSEILVVKVPSSLKQTAHFASVPPSVETAWYSRFLSIFARQASAHD